MKVSIITATYNSSTTILDTVTSLEEQDYPNIEYIIVDGNSDDNTIELINKNCSKVSVVISEPDDGIYNALNKGIAVATGDVIGFLHSDDVLAYSSAITDVVNTFNRSGSQSVYADLEYVKKNDPSAVVRKWKSGEFSKNKLRFGWMPPHPTFYVKRECYQYYGSFDEEYKISADYDSIVRLLWQEGITVSYLRKVIIKMKVGGMSNRNINNIISKSKEDMAIMRDNGMPTFTAILYKNLSKIPQFLRLSNE
ncbi:glycosyltransferase family 2 protein [Vibrio sp. M260118]|uniref:glycosyltransferase family 2 protein n=1 Tax=Vibrio sp. M260118 TaxID=3020896 RepID=UPI002F422A3D